jgi:hypothetical protein
MLIVGLVKLIYPRSDVDNLMVHREEPTPKFLDRIGLDQWPLFDVFELASVSIAK